MSGPDERTVDVAKGAEVMVANPSEGIYVFYTEREEEFIRTDCVVDVRKHW